MLVLLAAFAGLYGAASSDAFAPRHVEVTGATWTPEETVLAVLDVPPDRNLFVLPTQTLAGRLLAIPAVLRADVSVGLPDTIHVTVVEREALLAWKVGERRFLVDGTGFLFAELGPTPPAEAALLPVVDDRREESLALGVRSTLDAVSLDAATRIASLKPADLGSAASSLEFAVDDTSGFTVIGRPVGWIAVFGFYTPSLRRTDLIPGQVRLFRSMILGNEATVLRVILADDRSGTKILRSTPKSSASPAP